jgi:hypothetical protein
LEEEENRAGDNREAGEGGEAEKKTAKERREFLGGAVSEEGEEEEENTDDVGEVPGGADNTAPEVDSTKGEEKGKGKGAKEELGENSVYRANND